MTNSQKATTFNFMLLQFPVHRGQQGISATTIKRKHYFATIDVFHSLSLHFLHKNVCENSIILISCRKGKFHAPLYTETLQGTTMDPRDEFFCQSSKQTEFSSVIKMWKCCCKAVAKFLTEPSQTLPSTSSLTPATTPTIWQGQTLIG